MTGYEPYFGENEEWGDLSKVNPLHIHHLWLIRTALIADGYDWPIVIHCCYAQNGHAPKSFHHVNGESVATDFHFVTALHFNVQKAALNRVLDRLGLSQIMGVGNYPFWHTPGFHLDSRGERVRWTMNKKGKYIYEEK